MRPLGFVANEYALAVWGLRRCRRSRSSAASSSLDALFDEDMLGDDLEAWLAESALMKRTFRNCAIIAGLIERRFPGEEKTPPADDDLDRPRLRRAAQAPARPHAAARRACGRGDRPARHPARSARCSRACKGRIIHKPLDHVSPLAVPVMLEIGREMVYGEASDALLAEAEAELVKEAMS